MKQYRETIQFKTVAQNEFVNLTEEVQSIIEKSLIRNGSVTIFTQHTTMGVVINQNEPMLLQDFHRILEKIAPMDDQYAHDLAELTKNRQADGRSNGHAHCKALCIGTSVTVPVENNHLLLGSLQSIFAVECDGMRNRDVIVMVNGI